MLDSRNPNAPSYESKEPVLITGPVSLHAVNDGYTNGYLLDILVEGERMIIECLNDGFSPAVKSEFYTAQITGEDQHTLSEIVLMKHIEKKISAVFDTYRPMIVEYLALNQTQYQYRDFAKRFGIFTINTDFIEDENIVEVLNAEVEKMGNRCHSYRRNIEESNKQIGMLESNLHSLHTALGVIDETLGEVKDTHRLVSAKKQCIETYSPVTNELRTYDDLTAQKKCIEEKIAEISSQINQCGDGDKTLSELLNKIAASGASTGKKTLSYAIKADYGFTGDDTLGKKGTFYKRIRNQRAAVRRNRSVLTDQLAVQKSCLSIANEDILETVARFIEGMDSQDTLHNHIHNHMDAYMDVLNSVKVSAMTHESQDIWREINERASAISVHEKVIDDVESSLQGISKVMSNFSQTREKGDKKGVATFVLDAEKSLFTNLQFPSNRRSKRLQNIEGEGTYTFPHDQLFSSIQSVEMFTIPLQEMKDAATQRMNEHVQVITQLRFDILTSEPVLRKKVLTVYQKIVTSTMEDAIRDGALESYEDISRQFNDIDAKLTSLIAARDESVATIKDSIQVNKKVMDEYSIKREKLTSELEQLTESGLIYLERLEQSSDYSRRRKTQLRTLFSGNSS